MTRIERLEVEIVILKLRDRVAEIGEILVRLEDAVIASKVVEIPELDGLSEAERDAYPTHDTPAKLVRDEATGHFIPADAADESLDTGEDAQDEVHYQERSLRNEPLSEEEEASVASALDAAAQQERLEAAMAKDLSP